MVSKSSTKSMAQSSALLIFKSEKGPQEYSLDQGEFFIGRNGDLRLSDGRVSRRHARIFFDNKKYLLEDLGSSNGTFVNDEKIDQVYQLKQNDIIRIGPFEMSFMFHLNKSHPVDSEKPASELGPTQKLPSQARMEKKPTSEIDQTVPRGQKAEITVAVGEELILVPINDQLPLKLSLGFGNAKIEGISGNIIKREDGYWLENTPEDEPILVNGIPASGSTKLNTNDKLNIGQIELTFHLR